MNVYIYDYQTGSFITSATMKAFEWQIRRDFVCKDHAKGVVMYKRGNTSAPVFLATTKYEGEKIVK